MTNLLLPTLNKDGLSVVKFTVSTRWLKRYLAIHFIRFNRFNHKHTRSEVLKVYNSAVAHKKIIREEVLI